MKSFYNCISPQTMTFISSSYWQGFKFYCKNAISSQHLAKLGGILSSAWVYYFFLSNKSPNVASVS